MPYLGRGSDSREPLSSDARPMTEEDARYYDLLRTRFGLGQYTLAMMQQFDMTYDLSQVGADIISKLNGDDDTESGADANSDASTDTSGESNSGENTDAEWMR